MQKVRHIGIGWRISINALLIRSVVLIHILGLFYTVNKYSY